VSSNAARSRNRAWQMTAAVFVRCSSELRHSQQDRERAAIPSRPTLCDFCGSALRDRARGRHLVPTIVPGYRRHVRYGFQAAATAPRRACPRTLRSSFGLRRSREWPPRSAGCRIGAAARRVPDRNSGSPAHLPRGAGGVGSLRSSRCRPHGGRSREGSIRQALGESPTLPASRHRVPSGAPRGPHGFGRSTVVAIRWSLASDPFPCPVPFGNLEFQRFRRGYATRRCPP